MINCGGCGKPLMHVDAPDCGSSLVFGEGLRSALELILPMARIYAEENGIDPCVEISAAEMSIHLFDAFQKKKVTVGREP